MNQRIADFLVRHRLMLFIASIMFIALSSLGFGRLVYQLDYKVFFASDDPYLQAFETVQETFTSADNVVFVLVPKNGDMFSADALKSVVWLTEQAWKLPYSIRVDSLSNYQHTRADGDELIVEDLIPRGFDGSKEESDRIRKIALQDSLLVGQLLMPGGDASLLAVTLELPADQTRALPEMMEGPRGVFDLVKRFEQKHPEVEIHVTGVATSNYYLGDVASKDFGNLAPIMIGIVLVLVGLMTRSVSNTVVTLLIINVSVTATIGCVGLLGVPLNNISAIAPLVIITLAVAESVHLLSYYSLRLREGNDKVEAMRQSLASNLRPVFLTSFTTAVGFMGMNTIDSPPFVQFGYIAAAGIIIAWVFGHTMLPQLAIWFSKAHNGPVEVHEDKFHGAAAEWVIANPRKVFFGTLVVAISLSLCTFLNDMNDDNIGYFGKDMPIRVATELIEEKGLGFGFIEYTLDAKEKNGITDPAYLQKVDQFVTWLNSQPEVVHVNSFTGLLKRINQTMHGDDPAFNVLPESRELAAQYLLMYEMSLPVGMDLNNQIDTHKSKLRVTLYTPMLKARENLALEARIQEWLSAHAPELKVPGASPTIMFSHIGQNNLKSVMWGTISSTAIICLCMIFGFGSIRLGLMALLPNIFPAAIALGIWGLLVGEVNMGVAVIFTITSGIIVDDTIHLFSKFADGLRKGMTVDDGIRYTFAQAGRGVLITTVVLCAGFLVLTLSDFTVNKTLGYMVSGTIAIAILFDLLFLPSVLKVFPVNPAAFAKKS